MLFIDPNGNYPRYMGDLLATNPGWVEGQAIPDGWIYVNEVSAPNFNASVEKLEELEPAPREDGQYYQTWNVRSLTEAELEIVNAPTNARNRLANLGFTEAEIDALFMGLR